MLIVCTTTKEEQTQFEHYKEENNMDDLVTDPD